MLDWIASLGLLLANRILHVMPMSFNLWLGRVLSGTIYSLSGKRKMVTYSNIRKSFCHERSPGQIRAIARASYTSIAQVFAELIAMTKIDHKYLEKYVHVKNVDRLYSSSKNPNGLILLSAHFGNWELTLAVSAYLGVPLYVLARDQRMKKVNELLIKLRQSKGTVVVRKGTDVKQLIRVLRKGKSIGILGDQNAGANGKLLDLFGRPASTPIGPFRLAQKEGALIIPAFMHRKKGPYHEIILEDIISIPKDDSIVPYMEKFNRLLEDHIRLDPDHWFWMHKKWKMNPVKKIFVLDDGKKGHFNQSMAVVDQIVKYRQDEGRDPDHIKVNVVRVDFKSLLRKNIFRILSPLFGPFFQGRPQLLEWALDRESCDRILRDYADIVISTGSALSAVNIMLKIENYARNLTVLDPGRLNRGKFDIVVIPAHDVKKRVPTTGRKKRNVVITELAPNRISPEKMSVSSEGLSDDISWKGKLNVGLLIGGSNRHFAFSQDLVNRLISGLTELCEGREGYLHVTTSRRTIPEIEEQVKDLLSGNQRCPTLVMGSTDENPDTVVNIFKRCDLVIVSGDSISMVSEAVSSGKRVIVFMPVKITKGQTKYEKFTERLASEGYLEISEPADIKETVETLIDRNIPVKIPPDVERIKKELYRLF